MSCGERLDDALGALRDGFAVTPIHENNWIDDDKCACGATWCRLARDGLHPLEPRLRPITDEGTVRTWWSRWPISWRSRHPLLAAALEQLGTGTRHRTAARLVDRRDDVPPAADGPGPDRPPGELWYSQPYQGILSVR
jgi:hypothetical protein